MGEIKTRFVLEGESEYRSAMSQAASAVKKLNAEEKLAAAQFEATGNAEDYMAARTRILQERLEAQQGAVKAAGAALLQIEQAGGKGSKTWDTWNLKLLNAQTAMAKTEAEIKNLGNTMDGAAGEGNQLEESLSAVQKHTDFSAVIQGIDKITGAMEKAAKKVAKFAKGVYQAEVDASVWADDLITKSVAYGIDTETLQRWEYAEQFVDTEVDTMLKARDRLWKSKGTKAGGEILDALGINPEGIETMDLFWETLGKLQDAGENQEEWAQTLFGESFRDLMPLLQAGREEWDKWASEAPVVSDKQVQDLGALNDEFNKLNATLEKTKLDMLAELAPAFTDLSKALSDFIDSEAGQKAISDITQLFSDGMHWIVDNKGELIGTIEALGVAFAGLKISGGVLTFLNAASGLKNLLGVGAGKAATAAATGAEAASTATAAGTGFIPKLGATIATVAKDVALSAPFALVPALIVDAFVSNLKDMQEGQANYKAAHAEWDAMKALGFANDAELGAYWEELGASLLSPSSGVDVFHKMKDGFDRMLAGEDGNEWFESLYNVLPDAITDMMDAAFEDYDTDSTKWDYDPEKKVQFTKDIFQSLSDSIGEKLEVPTELTPDLEAVQQSLTDAGFTAPVTLVPNFSGEAITNGINGIGAAVKGFPHANGLSYVPYDGYPAILHRGERVLTRQENTQYGQYDSGDLVRAIKRAFSGVGVYMGSERVGNLTSSTVGGNINRETNARLRGFGG